MGENLNNINFFSGLDDNARLKHPLAYWNQGLPQPATGLIPDNKIPCCKHPYQPWKCNEFCPGITLIHWQHYSCAYHRNGLYRCPEFCPTKKAEVAQYLVELEMGILKVDNPLSQAPEQKITLPPIFFSPTPTPPNSPPKAPKRHGKYRRLRTAPVTPLSKKQKKIPKSRDSNAQPVRRTSAEKVQQQNSMHELQNMQERGNV